MNGKLITAVKSFVKDLREEMNMVSDDDLFLISITGEGGRVKYISIALYRKDRAGIISGERYAKLYEKAQPVLSLATSEYEGITAVMVMLSDEYETSIFKDKKILRICNLDA